MFQWIAITQFDLFLCFNRFQIHLFNFNSFIKNISINWNISTQQNAEGKGGNFTLIRCWFFLNNLETVKTVTVAFCSIQQSVIRNIHAKFGIGNPPQSPSIGQDGCICNFPIYCQSLTKVNCHNSRTSDDIDMKFGLVTKFDQSNKTLFKNWQRRHVSKISHQCYFFNLWPISKPDSGRIACESFISINNNLLSYKTELKNL